MKKILIMVLCVLPCLIFAQVGIIFTFGEGTVTVEAGTSYFEFDVFAQATASGTKLGTGMILINYNASAFGTEVNQNNKVTATKGALLSSPYPFPLYDIILNDHSLSRLAITFDLNIDYFGNPLPVTPTTLVHVKMEIADLAHNSNLSFQSDLMQNQQYYDDNATKYNPTTATDTLDETLPVELSSFTANMNNSLTGVNLTWVTQSESNLVGYGIYRGESDDLSQAIDLNAYITATNTSQTQVYIYTDSDVMPEQTYWYWLESREMNGINGFHGPICFSVPQQPVQTPQIPIVTGFQSLYPNPFNPDLNIRYAVQDDAQVTMVVCNLKGQIIKQLYNGQKSAGLHSLKWDGRDDQGLSCSSGLYFIRMQAGGRIINRKVMLMK